MSTAFHTTFCPLVFLSTPVAAEKHSLLDKDADLRLCRGNLMDKLHFEGSICQIPWSSGMFLGGPGGR